MLPKDKDAQISRFWDLYVEKSKRYGIKQDFIRWHVRHAELYIKSHSTQLKSHTALDVEQYLQAKGRSARLKDWQYRQIIDSLRILFVDVIASSWATNYPWDDMKTQARACACYSPDYRQTAISR